MAFGRDGAWRDGAFWYGGDWNPEQWPELVWHEDLALMREAGVNLVSVGVFAWARLEPEPSRYTFDWLDRVLTLAYEHGVQVNLATPTASPPPWFSLAHPDALPVTGEGVRLAHGSRDTYCAAAPGYRQAATRIAAALAEHYAGHPALAMWHVHNEYGTICYCDHAAAAFRRWLRRRYPDLDSLNQAWGTSFWSQHYTAWEQVLPPRATQYLPNPHQVLDYRRFWSDELLAAFREQRDLLRAATPHVPVTTNFAVAGWVPVDHRRWAAELDLVALDAYPDLDVRPDPDVYRDATAADATAADATAADATAAGHQSAFLADLARHWAGGDRPWLVMEQAPGTLRRGGAQVATIPGQLARLCATHLARGATGLLFFQWRASAAGAEQYHAAMVPHAGPESRIFREVRALGASLPAVAEVGGAPVAAEVAIGWHADSWWALAQPHLPSDRLDYLAALHRAHRALWERQVTADFIDLSGDLTAYRLVLVPSHYLADDAMAASVRAYVAGGGHLVVWYFSGIADRSGRVRLGGYPGAFRQVLGILVEQFHPLPPGETVALSDGTEATLWSEHLHLRGAEAVLRYAAGPLDGPLPGPLAGLPALTRHRYGDGRAWYVSTELAPAAYTRLVEEALGAAGVAPGGLPPGVETVTRRGERVSWQFVVNHTGAPVEVPARGVELVSGRSVDGRLEVPAGGFAVLRTPTVADGQDRSAL